VKRVDLIEEFFKLRVIDLDEVPRAIDSAPTLI